MICELKQFYSSPTPKPCVGVLSDVPWSSGTCKSITILASMLLQVTSMWEEDCAAYFYYVIQTMILLFKWTGWLKEHKKNILPESTTWVNAPLIMDWDELSEEIIGQGSEEVWDKEWVGGREKLGHSNMTEHILLVGLWDSLQMKSQLPHRILTCWESHLKNPHPVK